MKRVSRSRLVKLILKRTKDAWLDEMKDHFKSIGPDVFGKICAYKTQLGIMPICKKNHTIPSIARLCVRIGVYDTAMFMMTSDIDNLWHYVELGLSDEQFKELMKAHPLAKVYPMFIPLNKCSKQIKKISEDMIADTVLKPNAGLATRFWTTTSNDIIRLVQPDEDPNELRIKADLNV